MKTSDLLDLLEQKSPDVDTKAIIDELLRRDEKELPERLQGNLIAYGISHPTNFPRQSIIGSFFRGGLAIGICVGFAATMISSVFLFLPSRSSGLSPVGIMVPSALLIGQFAVLPTLIAALMLRAMGGKSYRAINLIGLMSPVFSLAIFCIGLLIHGLQ